MILLGDPEPGVQTSVQPGVQVSALMEQRTAAELAQQLEQFRQLQQQLPLPVENISPPDFTEQIKEQIQVRKRSSPSQPRGGVFVPGQ